ncbi:sigma 54-interacting transcriptional regulator, partial [Pelotomaculum isophthalicicum]|uniref:sigma 54-interacting transcriptional regulator n=1 Tax=Pelotomaculum isophthalicicum TaxID=342448 RepID=UPI0024063ADC
MGSPVLIGVISTHAELTSICRQISLPGVKLLINEGALEKSLHGLKIFEEKGVETLVTTRGNSVFIKEHTSLPVISIPENNFDIFLPLARASQKYGPNMTLFSYRALPKGLDEIRKVMGFNLKTIIFNNHNHLEHLLEQLKGSDMVIVGGGLVCQLASSLGFITEQVNMNKDYIIDAMEAARELAMARRVEKKEAYRLQTILDLTHEGIIATDEKGVITLFNKAAEKIFNFKTEDVLGCNIKNVLQTIKLQETLLTKEATFGEIISFENSEVVVNRVPVLNKKEEISGVVATIQPAQEIQELEEKIRRQLSEDKTGIRYNFNDIKGESYAIRSTIELARKFAQTDETVLIMGESGTGKELFAQSIHVASKRKTKPFLAINCAAIPGTLLESELFGYSEGAFTGARKGGKAGLFELAHGGTIFLDEIGEMPLDVQAKLLRVIQEKEVRRVG